MIAMRFDYRDVFKSARLAFSFQRIWIQFIGLLIGYLVYIILTYASLVLAGNNFGVIWSRFGLIPTVIGFHLSWYCWIIYVIGVIWFVFFWLVSSTGVARATYMYLKGNTFYTWKEAFSFALKKKGGSLISTPIAIAVIALLIVFGGVFVGLLGRIPYIGELGISFFSVIWFLMCLFLVFVLLALILSLFLTPAILATTDDDAFEGIFQNFSILYGQPLRFLLYEFLCIVVALFGLVVFAFFAKRAWELMTMILVWGMGDKYADLSYSASYLLQNWVYPVVAWSRALLASLGDFSTYFFFSRDFSAMELPLMMSISSWIFSMFLVLISGFILCYPFSVFNTGNALIFLILKKKKDNENLLERKDSEEEEEEEEEELVKEEKGTESDKSKAESKGGRKTKRKKSPSDKK